MSRNECRDTMGSRTSTCHQAHLLVSYNNRINENLDPFEYIICAYEHVCPSLLHFILVKIQCIGALQIV